jgi:hypothetical protein
LAESYWIGHDQSIAYMPVNVDEGMVRLLNNVWSRGLRTEFSCEGWPDGNPNPGFEGEDDAYIAFLQEEDAEKFILICHDSPGLFSVVRDRRVVRFSPHLLAAVTKWLEDGKWLQAKEIENPRQGMLR